MKKLNFQTQYNRHKVKGEKTSSISKTIPDQSMSVNEIMRRYTNGLPISGGKVPMYEGEESMPDLTKMDLADRQALLEAASEEIKDLRQKNTQRKIEATKRREQQLFNKAYEKLKAEGHFNKPASDGK